ncbi:polysaccharide biosynthesis protein [Cellulomonas fimi]|uniref:Polysaccharide biosynthesis protein n=1 Tax=Cellulomonas fimi (strain ATCC 484 / DSM 20113 / JCM 1341 / CCUG 24087 / LMG 16345 / NBRC 15513 / NCIMB 8980 / NCTC 7547 / NRS-133) TaxID=590998 RepID=F4GZE4_CELFA|nr:polysaccharide biosynthesis protein [Cellulomonas fimi]AEE44865.1 polysaccharide biosynthesis protein [Cellulomonas fimi ATCC 484]NNH08100.1 hypothetical protein [Cellulomonas fimi]VEH27522.1 Uncharacterised protein [Cellulomonas fimi]
MTRKTSEIHRSLATSVAGGLLPAVLGATGTVVVATAVPAASAAQLLLAWTVVGYLALTDFGLTRTASRLVSGGASPGFVVGQLWRISVPLGGILALVTLGLVQAVRRGLDGPPPPELVALCLVPIAASIQFPLIGTLEAQGRFLSIAVQRTANAMFTYLLPALAFSVTEDGLALAVTSIVGYRFVSAAFLFRATRVGGAVGAGLRARGDATDGVRSLATWLGVSSVVGPALLYADRLFLAALSPPVELWVYYVAISELMMKTYVLPSAVLSVLFPRFVADAASHSGRLGRLLGGRFALASLVAAGSGFALAYAVAQAGVLAFFEPLGSTTLTTSLVAAVAVSSTVLNWSSQVFIAYLQSRDAHRAVSLVQLALAVPYLLALVACVAGSSVLGVSVTWGARIAAVWIALWWLVRVARRREPVAPGVVGAAEETT